jgi:thiamine kinase-like enzyme
MSLIVNRSIFCGSVDVFDSQQSNKTINFLNKYVKPEQVRPIIDACEKLFGVPMQDPILVTGGRGTSTIILFKAGEKEYICRVTDATRPSFFIDPASEIHNMWAVNPLDVAPMLWHADLQTGIIIMDYVKSMRLTSEQLDDDEQSEKLYAQLALKTKELHGAPDFTKESTNIFTDLEKTVKMLQPERAPSLAFDVLKTIRSLESIMKQYEVSVPSHKDLHSNNVLFTGDTVYFIDWELGANCDRFVDLACLSIFYVFDSSKDDLLLEKYFLQPPTEKQKAQLFLMKQICLCFYGFRLLRRVTGVEKMDLSKETVDLNSLPKFKDFILECYNGCSKSFNKDELKLFPYMYFNEAMKNIQSAEYQNAVKILSE